MKKDKKWLKEQLSYLQDGVGESFNDYSKGLNSAYNTLELLIDKLEEPEQEKVVVPQFVADWIEGNKQEEEKWEGYDAESALNDSIHFTIYGLFANYPTTNKHVELRKPTLEWLNYDRSNYFKLVEAVRHGYTVEKEKLYQVQMPNGTFLIQSNVDVNGHYHWFNKNFAVYDNAKFKFTEQEIKAIDERYLAFKVEEVTK